MKILQIDVDDCSRSDDAHGIPQRVVGDGGLIWIRALPSPKIPRASGRSSATIDRRRPLPL